MAQNGVVVIGNGVAAGGGAAAVVGDSPRGDLEAAFARVERVEREPTYTLQPGGVALEVQHPDLHYVYLEIKDKLLIEADPVYKATLEEWDRRETYLGKRVDRREKTSIDLRNQVFNIVGFFSVFQGVVLTAVSQLKSSTGPHCGTAWFPVVLSGGALIVAGIGVWLKFTDLEALELSISNEKQAQKEVAGRAAKLRSHGLNFRFRTHVKEPRLIEPKAIWIRKLSVLVALSVFTGIFIASYFVILCDRLAIQSWNRGQASAPTGAPTSV